MLLPELLEVVDLSVADRGDGADRNRLVAGLAQVVDAEPREPEPGAAEVLQRFVRRAIRSPVGDRLQPVQEVPARNRVRVLEDDTKYSAHGR